MKKLLYCLSILLVFISCDGNVLKNNGLSGSNINFEEKTKPVSLLAPRVYLNHKNQFLKITEINRLDVTLNLSDKIVFSDEWRPENDLSKPVSWNDLEKGLNFKVKVSSFCSYDKQESKETVGDSSRRVFKEMSSPFYSPSFSIFEILPQEILLDNLDEIFYCSFIFAFKNEKGQLNHYNIAQQTIRPLFEGSTVKGLSLIRETEMGYYLPALDKILPQHISKISLLNNTGVNNQKYHLFCTDFKLVMESELNFNVAPIAPIFLNLANNVSNDSLKEGLKTCRFISENKKSITGMTNPFQLDLSSLKNSRQTIDLKNLTAPVVLWKENLESHSSSDEIPLNSYFSFESLKNAELDYSAVDIIVNTHCFKKEYSEKKRVFYGEYKMPFRKKFPIMAITPKEIFFMDMDSKSYGLWKQVLSDFQKKSSYTIQKTKALFEKKQSSLSSCLYNIKLRDRYSKKNKIAFDLSYSLKWNEEAYGMDHKALFIFLEEKNIVSSSVGGERRYKSYQFSDPEMTMASIGHHSYEIRRIEKPFLSIKRDIYPNEVNYFYLNFFDVIDDSIFQFNGPGLDRVLLQCNGRKGHLPMEISYSYNDLNQVLSLKAFFLNHDMVNYVKKHEIINCRLMLYEDQILRYFSKEIRVTP